MGADLASISPMSSLVRDARELKDGAVHSSLLQRQLLAALHELAAADDKHREQTREIAAIQRLHEAHLVVRQRQCDEGLEALNRDQNGRVAQRTRELQLALDGEQAARR